ncbi:hybrid sensor histidine kinase/response regulator [Leptospira levettii]|uniref:hybrid sensor histidine kinase/response regulator n=1 Tax=Leptospira levettii TaxID=2023178 RepID=UPI0010824003|nr:response regulator [Leptospira levettii]MCG6148309.1 response regulator [Leptospira levettii]MCW7508349.1 response regulator [Leptospira levettii]MCW7519439.1 response regulator [Leptospira levettii]TGK98248.1 response regulator [Leptospira levettii]
MNEKRILLAEDDLISATLLQESLTSLGYQVTLAEDGRKAKELFLENPFPIVITDYDMPDVNGIELIDFLKEEEVEPIIIVLTNHSETSIVIDIMRRGIYDYVVKPIEAEELSLKLQRAFEIHNIKKLEKVAKREREMRLESHLDWIKWKEKMGGSGRSKNLNQNLFESLKTSFNQGTGFGALVSLLKIVSDSAEIEGDFYKIDTEIMSLIKTNAEMAEKALYTFSEIDEILNGKIELETISLSNLYNEIKNVTNEMSNVLDIQKNYLYLSEKKSSFDHNNIKIHKNYFIMALKEILTNACKFSIPESSIHIVMYIEGRSIVISVYNSPILNADRTEGIPLEFENIIFEPFFRLTKYVYDDYKTLDFGLGLTKVEAIIKRFEGKIEIKNIIDHLYAKSQPKTKVICRISIPLVPEKMIE